MPWDESLPVRFARVMAQLDRDDTVMDRFCEAGQLMLDGDGAAITANYDGPDRHTLAATSALALMIEDAQDVVGEGPGFDAVRTHRVVSGEFGLFEQTSWPLLEDSLAGLGFTGAVLALPLAASDRTLGVLVVHRHHTSLTFDPAVAAFLASNLGVAVANELSPDDLERELSDDWSVRAVVHQATGMVTAQLRVRPDDALVLLRARAYALGASLTDVAAAVVDRDLRFDHHTEGEIDG